MQYSNFYCTIFRCSIGFAYYIQFLWSFVFLIPELIDRSSSYDSFVMSLIFLSVLSITSAGFMSGTGDLAVMKPISLGRPYGIKIFEMDTH